MPVIKHRAVDKACGVFGKLFQDLIVCGHNAPHFFPVHLLKNGTGKRAANLRFCPGAHFVNQKEGAFAASLKHELHAAQVAAVGRKVIFK